MLEEHHPASMPHQHLAILAVASACQGQGTRTVLLNARHREIDRDAVPAYLEASSPRARDLYLRHGYTLRPDAPFCLPGGGPPLWPMWRKPRCDQPALYCRQKIVSRLSESAADASGANHAP
jgi:hypothetical protein